MATTTNAPAPASRKTAADITGPISLGDEARKLLRDGMQPRPYLDSLIEKQHYTDAAKFLAHMLPKREAVWWACLCTRQEGGAALPPKAVSALQVAEGWVAAPSDEKSRAAYPVAQEVGIATPAGLTAMAVFFSGSSLGPPEYQAVPPPENLTGKMVANAVILSVVRTEPAKAAEKYKKVLALGLDVAAGKNRWKEGGTVPPKPAR
jgi:hypothetical protein